MATAALPGGPKGDLIGGHIRQFRQDGLGFLGRCAREHGDFVPVRFGHRRAIVLSHPDYVEQVLVANNRSFVKSPAYRLIMPLASNGLFTSEGEFWRRQRRLAQPAFHRERITAYGQSMVAFTQHMLDDWQDGQVRDVREEMMQLTLRVVAKALFDADVATHATQVGRSLTVALEYFNSRLNSLLMFVPDVFPTPQRQRLQRALRQLDEIVYQIIAERRGSGEDRGDLLSILMAARDEDDGTRMTDAQVRDEVMTVLLAGHETTAIALTWAWWLLSQHPQAESALLAELSAVLGGRAPASADFPRLAYAQAVVNESLRLYPPLFALGREALKDCEIGGHPVKVGTILIMSPWVIHRDPRYFDEPEQFKPERWLDGLARRLPRFAYFPFGGGPRQCIGNSFALLEAALVLATVAQRFRLELVPGHPVVPEPTLTLRPKHGMRMRLHRR